MDLVDIAQAEAERDAGMALSFSNAETKHEKWGDEAYDFLVSYAKGHAFFISEDVSAASRAMGMRQPDTDRAWGTVYVKAVKNDVIVQNGSGRSMRRHKSICPRWESLVLKGAR